MKTVRFLETHTVTAPDGPTYESGSVHSFRDSTAYYYVDRGVAELLPDTVLRNIDITNLDSPKGSETLAQVVNGNTVDSASTVAKPDSSDTSERPIDEPKRGPGRPRKADTNDSSK